MLGLCWNAVMCFDCEKSCLSVFVFHAGTLIIYVGLMGVDTHHISYILIFVSILNKTYQFTGVTVYNHFDDTNDCKYKTRTHVTEYPMNLTRSTLPVAFSDGETSNLESIELDSIVSDTEEIDLINTHFTQLDPDEASNNFL